jgi:hypothetical protein
MLRLFALEVSKYGGNHFISNHSHATHTPCLSRTVTYFISNVRPNQLCDTGLRAYNSVEVEVISIL